MGFALVTAVGWGLNWPVPKYLLTELPLLSTLKQGTIDAFALSSANFRCSRSRPWSGVSEELRVHSLDKDYTYGYT